MAANVGISTITAPELKGLLGEQVIQFDVAYDAYVRKVTELNATSSLVRAMHPVGYKACIPSELLLSLTAMSEFEGCTSVDQVKDTHVKTWVKNRSRCSADDTPAQVKGAVEKAKFRVNNSDPRGAVMQFFADILTELRRNRVSHLVTESPKTLIRQIIPKLQPAVLRENIETLFDFWPREKQTDFNHFMKEVSEAAVGAAKFGRKISDGASASSSAGKQQPFSRKRKRDSSPPKEEKSDKADKKPPQNSKKPKGKKGWSQPCLNPACDKIHPVATCDKTSSELKTELLNEYRKNKSKEKKVSSISLSSRREHNANRKEDQYTIVLHGDVECVGIGDYGADLNVIPPRVLDQIRAGQTSCAERKLEEPIELQSAFVIPGTKFSATCSVIVDIKILLPCGPIRLRNVQFYVSDFDMDEILLGRPLLKCIGFDLGKHLASARPKLDNADVMELSSAGNDDAPRAVESLSKVSSSWGNVQDSDPVEPVPNAATNMGDDTRQEIDSCFESIVKAGKSEGLSARGVQEAEALLQEHRDVFRIKLGSDPPAKIAPFKVTLKQDAQPVRCAQRRYAPPQRAFLISTVTALVGIGAIYANANAKWASPALAVPKPGSDTFRFTVDLRAPNKQTIPIASAMPDLETNLQQAAGSTCFAKADMNHAYWQLALDDSSQECMSIQTPIGVFTPRRILQGSTDSGNHFQATTAQVFSELQPNLMQWLDDFILHAKSEQELLHIVKRFLELCAEHGLKLHAKKFSVFSHTGRFCGRILDKDGVTYDPRRLSALTSMKEPERAQDLQQFLCAANWMRTSIPEFSRRSAPLHRLLESIYKTVGKRTKRAIRHTSLSGLWGTTHSDAFQDIKNHLSQATKLSFPKETWTLCLFSDASDTHWASVLTQVRPSNGVRAITSQEHEPLAFLSGAFTGHAMKWSTVEKEAFAVVESMSRLDHLTSMVEVSLFTDHSNLRYIFDPYGQNPGINKQVAHKLARWALKLSCYRYIIEYLPGEDNVWADILTRWGARPGTEVRALRISALLYAPISTTSEMEFDWPAREDLIESQSRTADVPPQGFHASDGLHQNRAGVVWVPSSDESLRMRIMIAAHCGLAGHRGYSTTLRALNSHFFWRNMSENLKTFCNSCLHCLSSDGRERVPRPLGSALHASKPNEVIHFDFCYIGKSVENVSYVLILKDDLSSYVRMYPCQAADSDATATALIEWFTTFGPAHQWVSDQGSHFKNETIRLLKERLRSAHHFTLPYCPWSNGTVEVVCRELLRAIRALSSELKIPFKSWPSLLPTVQSVLNSTSLRRLGDRCPLEVFTGLKPTTPIAEIKRKKHGKLEHVSLDTARAAQLANVELIHTALENMHKSVAESVSNSREARVRIHNQKTGVHAHNFIVGDFVLRSMLQRSQPKLRMKWAGPYRVQKVLSNFIFELEDLLTSSTTTVHGSRIKLFRNSDMSIGAELDEHLKFQAGEYCVVDRFEDIRQREGAFEVHTVWKGFEDEGPAWEPLDIMKEDVPVLLHEFLSDISTDGTPRQRRLAHQAKQH